MTQLPIDTLCRELLGVLRRDPRGTRVAQLLGSYAEDHGDWRDWARFGSVDYTRNLVQRTGAYELLLLCWGEGQTSPIHDHAGQHCWMAVLDGTVEEVHYRYGNAPGGPLVEGNVRRFDRGQVAYIVDDIALHLVRAAPKRRAVSLHLYSRPIDACRAYDAATGRARRIEVGYHSVRGVLCGDKPAAAVRAEWS